MVKFAHIADVHLGAWRYPELSALNLSSFKKAISECIKEKVDFVIIAGDLFDIAMPSVDILKDTVTEFKKLHDASIKCYIVPGSHDFSLTGRTFIDVLEKTGFCRNVAEIEQKLDQDNVKERLCLKSYIDNEHKILIAGIPGKKTGIELEYFKKIEIENLSKYDDFLKILVIHTTLTESKPKEAIMDSIAIRDLPDGFDYYAAGHLHICDIKEKNKSMVVYPGPIFPNNSEELEKLNQGSFFIVNYDENKKELNLEKKEIKFNPVMSIEIDVDNLPSDQANAKIIKEIENKDIKDKIVILKIAGCLTSGKTSDIDFDQIKEKTKEAYLLLKNTSKLTTKEFKVEINYENVTIETIESEFIKKYESQVQDEFKKFISFCTPLMENLNFEKKEEEKKEDFRSRIFDTVNKIMNLELQNES